MHTCLTALQRSKMYNPEIMKKWYNIKMQQRGGDGMEIKTQRSKNNRNSKREQGER